MPISSGRRADIRPLGITDPLSLTDYEAHEGWAGLKRALTLDGAAIVEQITQSGLRGRGGAAFPAGIKWQTVLKTDAAQKYIVCNADEGDSGTFSDRMTLEGDPYMLIEGMTIAGLAVVRRRLCYIRSRSALLTARTRPLRALRVGYLGQHAGAGRAFICSGNRGSYVCGKRPRCSTDEGKRGIGAPNTLPAIAGMVGSEGHQQRITFASVPLILARGAQFYRDYGMGRSQGTLPFQLAGNIKYGGLVEKAFGITLRELLYDFGGGSRSGRPIKAVQVGGPLGTYLPESQWDIPLDYEAYAAAGAVVGHGGIVVHDDTADMSQLARYAMEFCAIDRAQMHAVPHRLDPRRRGN